MRLRQQQVLLLALLATALAVQARPPPTAPESVTELRPMPHTVTAADAAELSQAPSHSEAAATDTASAQAADTAAQAADTAAQSAAALELQSQIERAVLLDLRSRIDSHQASQSSLPPRRRRPFVTLTYAQGLDGSIASADRRPVGISGRASRVMTHGLRSLHDGILVGGGTVRMDNPRLNVREWVGAAAPAAAAADQHPPPRACSCSVPPRCPRPIVLSSDMAHLPLSINASGAVILTSFKGAGAQRWLAARAALDGSRPASAASAAGDFIIAHCSASAGSDGDGEGEGGCDLSDALSRLSAMGFRSIMVEGGGRVIGAFLRAGAVDRLVVTVAPIMIGGYSPPLAHAGGAPHGCEDSGAESDGRGGGDSDSRSYVSGRGGGGVEGFGALRLRDVRYVQLGDDVVVMATPAPGGGGAAQQQAHTQLE